eukprot:scaffold23633_cov94-Skeletonema_dohrnii-CCMP3373.AAC.2
MVTTVMQSRISSSTGEESCVHLLHRNYYVFWRQSSAEKSIWICSTPETCVMRERARTLPHHTTPHHTTPYLDLNISHTLEYQLI